LIGEGTLKKALFIVEEVFVDFRERN